MGTCTEWHVKQVLGFLAASRHTCVALLIAKGACFP